MKKVLILLIVAALLLTAGCVAIPTIPAATEGAASTVPTAIPETTTLAPETAPVTTEAPAPTEPAATETPVTEAPSTEAPVPTTEAPAPVDPWSLLGSGGYTAGSYTDELGNEYDYSYDLPRLLADTEGALAINAALDARFGAQVRYEQENMEQNLSIGIVHIGFYGVVWEDVLTLVVITHGYYDNWADYGVYSYEVSTGRWLTTPMILERMGVSQQNFLEACRARFHDHFVETYSDLSEEYYSQVGYYDALARQTTDEYVNLDLAVYPEEGGLVVVAPILSLAGPAYVYEPLTLDLGK